MSQPESSLTGPPAESGALERVDVVDERPIGWTEYEHRVRYQWAASVVTSGKVLDIACGTGHGSELLAKRGEVTGIDRDEAAVARAKSRTDGVFEAASVPPVPLDDETFDWIVSFETIEHIEDDAAFLRELARVLKSDGELLISTPNGALADDASDPANEFHIREYTLKEFRDALSNAGFEISAFVGQRNEAIGGLWRKVRGLAYRGRSSAKRSALMHRVIFGRILDMDVTPVGDGENPAFFIARCRKVA